MTGSLLPLTRLGQVLGDLDIEIDIPEDIDLLEIKKGRVNLQRFFYWNICKAYYRKDWSIEQMNNTNFDWYAPTNAFRQTPEEVRAWCGELNLEIEREYIDDAGITIVARKGTK